MITRAWKVYGAEGHRQRESFGKSYKWDFSNKEDGCRIIEVLNSDRTGTNDYSILRISRNTAEECEAEMRGQISDGVFENSRVGRIEEISEYGGIYMFYAMYGEYSNGDEKYFVNRCTSEDSGEENCMCELTDYEDEGRQLEYYTCINGMPEELERKYNPDGDNVFVDGVLMRDVGDDYEVVTSL